MVLHTCRPNCNLYQSQAASLVNVEPWSTDPEKVKSEAEEEEEGDVGREGEEEGVGGRGGEESGEDAESAIDPRDSEYQQSSEEGDRMDPNDSDYRPSDSSGEGKRVRSVSSLCYQRFYAVYSLQ
ncbi:UNVERIFIED_CONTAM: hypothetical protein FKN15_033585 [Acipenser sinensis]